MMRQSSLIFIGWVKTIKTDPMLLYAHYCSELNCGYNNIMIFYLQH